VGSYNFKPDLCFNARCWWQLGGVRVEGEWGAAVDHLAPLWVRFESGDGEDGWIRAEPEGALEPSSSLRVKWPGILCDVLWFGVYQIYGQFTYEIRPAYFGETAYFWPRLEYAMTKDFGYLGMSGSPQPAGTHNAPQWAVDGLDPQQLKVGERLSNLELIDPSGRAVRRYRQFGRPYLATHQGIRGGAKPGSDGRACPAAPQAFGLATSDRQSPVYSQPLVQVSWMRTLDSSGISGLTWSQIHLAITSLVGFSRPGMSFR